MSSSKYSGIEWVDKISSDWDMGRVSHRFELALGKMVESDAGFSRRAQYPYLCAANLKWQGIDATIQKSMYFSSQERRHYEVHEGDLLITEGGSIGTSCIYRGELGPICYMQNSVIRARGKTAASNRFLAYWLEFVCGSGYLDVLCNKATIAHYTKDKVSKTPFPLMQEQEYEAIANAIDEVCVPISRTVEALEDGVSVLERYRASVIHEAVTKGLDPNVPMKPSGIDWIGDIPEGWEINRLRYLAKMESGATPSKDNLEYWEGDIPWVSSIEVKSELLEDTSLHISEAGVSSCSTRLLPAGTLVMVVRSGILQHTMPVALLGRPMTINQDIKALSFGSKVSSKYFLYFVKGNNQNLLKVLCKDKSTVDNINQEYLKSLLVPLPPLSEQKEIVAYLDARTTAIDAVLETKRKQIDVLKRCRQSLIYEYVTGKRRVGQEV